MNRRTVAWALRELLTVASLAGYVWLLCLWVY